MKKKCFDWENLFAFIWNHADHDGLWGDDDATLAEEFNVSEDEAHAMLTDLCDRGLIERVCEGKYAVVRWPERDDPAEQELRWWEIHR